MIRSSELENHRLSITSPSLLESLTIVPAQRRAPAAGEVEIEVFAVGLNFMEVLLALGMLSAPPSGIQFGLECAGVVTRCGEGVFAVAIGDAVLAVGESCLCRFVTVPAATLARIPPGVSFCDAATIPVAFITAASAC